MEPKPAGGYNVPMNANRRPRRLALLAGACALVLAGSRAFGAVAGVEPGPDRLWTDIKSDTYAERGHFARGAARLSARLDEQIAELKAKRAAMTTDTKDWDFAMKEVEESRTALADRIDGLGAANTPETWVDARDKVGEAWHRSQQAVDKMNATRTS